MFGESALFTDDGHSDKESDSSARVARKATLALALAGCEMTIRAADLFPFGGLPAFAFCE
jgi:hypothetical protein